MAKSVARAARRETRANQRAVDQMNRNGQTPLEAGRTATLDSFQNIPARLGYGTDNQASFGTYNYNPITNLRMTLDLAYRSSWICRAVVQGRAKDMTRAGIDFDAGVDPQDADSIHRALDARVWKPLRRAIQWGRLYGGAGAFIMIDGQAADTPLRIDRVGKGQFQGLLPLDRWLLEPSVNDLVTDALSQDFGKPKYYRVVGETPLRSGTRIHHSRFVRFEGDDLPYYQSLTTMLWGMSVLEPVWDRLLSFDSTTTGIAQLVYRASIRNLYIDKWKEIVAAGGKMLEAQLQALDWVRRFQGNEGITLLDANDRFESLQFAFTGLDAVLIQMGQQLAGATRYPLVILFGQSPVGFNSTGESDIRNYYDSILSDQNDVVRPGLTTVIRCVAASEGVRLGDDLQYRFNPLWQLTDEQKASTAATSTQTILGAYEAGVISRKTALQEMRQQSRETGMWTNITEEDIDEAESEPPSPMGLGGVEAAGAAPGEFSSPPASPGEEPPPADSFLPRRPFLPSSIARRDDEDSAGGLERGELERRDNVVYPPLHAHLPALGGERMRRVHLPRRGMVRVHLHDTDLPGRVTEFAGHRIVVEVERGQRRTAGSSGGAVMASPYGYFPGTIGNDGDCVDVFLGDDPASDNVWVVEQVDPDTGDFHQHKVFLGFGSRDDVEQVFRAFYADGRGEERWSRARQMSLADFSSWLERRRVQPQTFTA